MPLFSTIAGWFTKATASAVKDVTGSVRDVQEIRKTRIETELKARELDRQKSLVTLATFEEVKEFDPKYKQIRSHLEGGDLLAEVAAELHYPHFLIKFFTTKGDAPDPLYPLWFFATILLSISVVKVVSHYLGHELSVAVCLVLGPCITFIGFAILLYMGRRVRMRFDEKLRLLRSERER